MTLLSIGHVMIYGMFKVETDSGGSNGTQISGHDPIHVSVSVNGRQIMTEVDTGAGHTIVSEDIYTDLWGPDMLPLQPPDVGLHTYTGESIKVLGRAMVHVEHNG